jgi:hypothetical protein
MFACVVLIIINLLLLIQIPTVAILRFVKIDVTFWFSFLPIYLALVLQLASRLSFYPNSFYAADKKTKQAGCFKILKLLRINYYHSIPPHFRVHTNKN